MGHCSLSPPSTSVSTRISVTVSSAVLLCVVSVCLECVVVSGFHSSRSEKVGCRIRDYLIEAWLCDLSRIHQQKEGAEKEEGAPVWRAASSCHHSIFLWWDTHRSPQRKLIHRLLLLIFIDSVSSWLRSSLLIDSCCSSVRLGQHCRMSSWSTSYHYMELPAVHHGCSPPAAASHSERHRRYCKAIVTPVFLSSSPHSFWGSHDILFMFLGCRHNFLWQLCCGRLVVWSRRRLQPAVWPAPWLLWWWWKRCAHLF